jgi:hypothetical protein
LIVLATACALGHVEEKTSYGLTGVLLIIGQIVPHVVKNTKTAPEEPEDPGVAPSKPMGTSPGENPPVV